MNIEETKIYKFVFQIGDTTFKFDMPAKDKETAIDSLKSCLTKILADLQMEFPNRQGKK